MQILRASVIVAIALAASTLTACGALLPPSEDDIAGSYSAAGATVVMDADGSCEVSGFPASVDVGPDGEPVFGTELIDGSCTWELGELLYSGAWELQVVTTDAVGDDLQLQWLHPFGEDGCLVRTLGDPDGGEYWRLC
ncbi:hypothetical protein [Protaetiibacter intestinalis]|uniref:Lipoprotein n=1 Tax=Protaetiibacter intestinalis TaxID=2419774 RepID=A0A387B7B1_9MICO|nr:hypothetical protein [Protaetiibacter intestinalis]AYF97009.1 hypothetical protein D7I47_01225 [Protaetiibacter intestinalis]